MAALIGHWSLARLWPLGVERKSDGDFMGVVGMINPEGWVALEIGWDARKAFWGKAMPPRRHGLRCATLSHRPETTRVLHRSDNVPSQQVASGSVRPRPARDDGDRRQGLAARRLAYHPRRLAARKRGLTQRLVAFQDVDLDATVYRARVSGLRLRALRRPVAMQVQSLADRLAIYNIENSALALGFVGLCHSRRCSC